MPHLLQEFHPTAVVASLTESMAGDVFRFVNHQLSSPVGQWNVWIMILDPKTLRQIGIYKAKSKQIMKMVQTRFGEDCPIAMIFIEVGQWGPTRIKPI